MPAMAHWGQLQYGIWVDKNKTTRTFVEFLADMYVKQVGYFHIQFFLCEYSQKMAQRGLSLLCHFCQNAALLYIKVSKCKWRKIFCDKVMFSCQMIWWIEKVCLNSHRN